MGLVIPVKPGDLTAPWMSEALGHRVDAVEVDDLGEGKGILAAVLRVQLQGDGVPRSLVAKLPSPHPENYNVAVAYRCYEREVQFYKHVAGHLDVFTPACLYGDVDDDGTNFVLLLEEITGATQPDQIAGLTIEEAERILDAVASLHAHWWQNPALDQLHWLPTYEFPPYQAVQGQLEHVFPLFVDLWGDKVAPEALETASRNIHHVNAKMAEWVAKPATFAHYDLRGDNLLFGGSPGEGVLSLLDWQLSLRAPAAVDLAYFLSTNLTIADRRSHEQRLLRRYHDRIVELGVRDYALEQLEDDYRELMLNTMNMVIIGAILDPGNDRGRALVHELVTRSFQANADLFSGEFVPD
jgi:aminoglycoside/choline kinase family phosphotransferase